jgi:hypothetical protein
MSRLPRRHGVAPLFPILLLSAIPVSAMPPTIELPRTGQTSCWDPAGVVFPDPVPCIGLGVDGSLLVGWPWPAPRFLDPGDGTVTDTLTGLIWLENANCGARGWNAAIDDARTLATGQCGLSDGSQAGDWRLPNAHELLSLIDAEVQWNHARLVALGFFGVQNDFYWTSTTHSNSSNYAHKVSLGDGRLSSEDKSASHPFWAVRGNSTGPAAVWRTGQTTVFRTGDDGNLQAGVAWPWPRLIESADGTVLDVLTGLTWPTNANCFGLRRFYEALEDAAGLASGECGLTDGSTAGNWRLPNRVELRSLLDFSEYMPMLPDGHPFTGVDADAYADKYWTSTTDSEDRRNSWYVSFSDGRQDGWWKTAPWTAYVWPVRGGRIGLAFAHGFENGFTGWSAVKTL